VAHETSHETEQLDGDDDNPAELSLRQPLTTRQTAV